MVNQQPSMRSIQDLLASVHGDRKSSPMVPFNFPVSSQPMASQKLMPTAPAKSQEVLRAETKEERVVTNLTNRILESAEELNAAGISEFDALNLAFIYRDWMPGDEISPISIKMVRNFLESIKISNETGYNKLMAYYNVLAEERTTRKTEKMRNAAHSILSQYRTIENAYQYSYIFREVANKMAPKLQAPESMGVVERVKWLRIWAVIIADQMLFWGDLDKNGKLKSADNTKRFNEFHVFPETMLFVWDDYLSNLPDGAILYDMLKRMIGLFPETARNAVLKYGEITSNVSDVTKVEHIRNLVKKHFFPRPWLVQSGYFCVVEGIKNFPATRLARAVTAWKNGGIDNLPTYDLPFYDVYNNCKLRTVTCYQYDTVIVNGKEINAGVSCREELEMYVELYKWLLEHPDFKFGAEKKTLEEYGIADLLEEKIDLESVAASCIVAKGFARDEADVNFEMIKLLRLEENAQFFKDFVSGRASAIEVFANYAFSSENQAIACFSKTSKVSPMELNKMAAALKRINTFGMTSGTSFSDIAYLELFKYLVKHQPTLVKGYANTYKRLLPQ